MSDGPPDIGSEPGVSVVTPIPAAAVPPRAWTRLDTAVLVGLLLGAGFLRFVALGRPNELVFDEIFYARNACQYVIGDEGVCGVAGLASRAHPPLGNWTIASGIAAFGFHPAAWRFPVAVLGTASVGLVYLLTWRLLRGVTPGVAVTVGAAVAGGLLAIDFLHLVQSRIAMLDALITFWVIGAVTAIVLDRDRRRDRPNAPWWWRFSLGRPWRLVAGVCLGAALATKWSGAFVAPAVIGLVALWEVAHQRGERPGAGWSTWITGTLRREALPTVVLLILVPIVVYVASYTGRMPGELLALPWDPASVWNGIWTHQRAMLDFHTGLGGEHPYQSPPWSWPLLRRPVALWFDDAGGTYRHIMAVGNPLTWWAGMAAVAGMAVTWARSGWRLRRPEPVLLAAAGATYLPWMILSGDRSQTFLWYLLPTVPFVCAALGVVAAWAWARTSTRVAAAVSGVVVVASFGFFLPVLIGMPMEPDAWRSRMLFTDCERPDGTSPQLPDDTTSSGSPPAGWCWI